MPLACWSWTIVLDHPEWTRRSCWCLWPHISCFIILRLHFQHLLQGGYFNGIVRVFTRLKLWLSSAKQLCKWLYGFPDLFCLNDSAQFANQIKADFSNCHSCTPSRSLQSQLHSPKGWYQWQECYCFLAARLVTTNCWKTGRWASVDLLTLFEQGIRRMGQRKSIFFLKGEKLDRTMQLGGLISRHFKKPNAQCSFQLSIWKKEELLAISVSEGRRSSLRA